MCTKVFLIQSVKMFKAYKSTLSKDRYIYLENKSLKKKATALASATFVIIGVTTLLFLTFFYFPLLAVCGCLLSAIGYRVFFGGSRSVALHDSKLDISVIEEEIVNEDRLIFKMETVSR